MSWTIPEFDHRRAAQEAGWMQIGNGRWIKRGAGGCYDGTAEELCRFLGIGPEWEAWRRQPYQGPKKG